ncbi:radical sam domain-containing protein [Nannochloropsis gaditana]|uniref:Radical sam domain-containing protein n=1 Tax=Nannochloropsis gaditana TaxID=72520 RepID=W7U4E1_9STRA|nr:radical sam domain-containing protein [Nannochloropsis gaditana]
MVKARKLSPLPVFDEASVRTFLEERGIKQLHARQLWKVIIKNRPKTLQEADGLAKLEMGKQLPTGMVAELAEHFVLTTSRVVEKHVSGDGTVKLLVELQDGQRVEAVIIRHEGRNTLCVSSQIGCQMGCSFCATGTMGIKGNLLGGEILEQLYHASGVASIRNIVFMGMGEPLQNYDAVMDAVRGMTDVKRFRLSHHQVTISTVGIVHAIKRMTADFPQLNLALSLHAPSQALRQQIVPSAKAFPIEKLLAVCLEHTRVSKKPLFVEYVLLKGVNDRPEHARELGQLLVGASVIVNLIPYNPTDVAMDFETPEDDDVDTFYTVLAHDYKLLTTVRVHHGREIGGACGQLALTQPGKGESAGPKGAPAVNDIEDLMDGGGRRGAKKGERPWGKNRGGGGAAGRKVARAALGGGQAAA